MTVKAREALESAQQIAQQRSHQELDVDHLLLALLEQRDGLVQPLLQKLGVAVTGFTQAVITEVDRHPKVAGSTSLDLFAGPSLKKALDAAPNEATKLKDEYVSTEHLLLAVISEAGPNLKKLLLTHGLTREAVLKGLLQIRGNQRVTV